MFCNMSIRQLAILQTQLQHAGMVPAANLRTTEQFPSISMALRENGLLSSNSGLNELLPLGLVGMYSNLTDLRVQVSHPTSRVPCFCLPSKVMNVET